MLERGGGVTGAFGLGGENENGERNVDFCAFVLKQLLPENGYTQIYLESSKG